MTADFISSTIHERLAARPEYKPADIVKDMHTEFGVEIKYKKAWRAKEHASLKIDGTHEESYAYLPKYCKDLAAANPGDLIVLDRTTENKFQRVFICYGACAKGFANCRPILGLDSTSGLFPITTVGTLLPQSALMVPCFRLHMLLSLLKITRIGFGLCACYAASLTTMRRNSYVIRRPHAAFYQIARRESSKLSTIAFLHFVTMEIP